MTDSRSLGMEIQREADLRYHVPKNQCYEGSRGRQSGNVHLHVTEDLFSPPLVRKAGATLCGKRGWYERTAEAGEASLCPLCVKRAGMYGFAYRLATPESEKS